MLAVSWDLGWGGDWNTCTWPLHFAWASSQYGSRFCGREHQEDSQRHVAFSDSLRGYRAPYLPYSRYPHSEIGPHDIMAGERDSTILQGNSKVLDWHMELENTAISLLENTALTSASFSDMLSFIFLCFRILFNFLLPHYV